MSAAGAARLTSSEGQGALRLAAACPDPGSLAAATSLRRHMDADLAAAALQQEHLRRRARPRFGERAARMLFTAEALEQTTRPAVARWRAARLVDAGARHVVDLGCGIGADAIAFAEAGLRVTAVEVDAERAELARWNLRDLDADVVCGDAVEFAATVSPSADTAVFCDPARRTDRGRTWRVDQFTPPWQFVLDLLQQHPIACAKLGPGLPSELVPGDVDARWVSDHGDVVEVGLWRLPTHAPGWTAPGRSATLLPGGHDLTASADGDARARDLPTGPVGHWLLEPDGAVLRAGLAASIAPDADLWRLAPGVGYLSSDQPVETPFATAFEVLEVMDAGEKTLRAWVRDHDIGTLEIKKRAVDVDPAALRRRLKPRGRASATLVLTPTIAGTRCLVVRRVGDAWHSA